MRNVFILVNTTRRLLACSLLFANLFQLCASTLDKMSSHRPTCSCLCFILVSIAVLLQVEAGVSTYSA